MSKKEIVLWLVLADFVALTGYAMYTQGALAFYPIAFEFMTSGGWGAQLIYDFVIALSFALGWVVLDARKLGIHYWPYVVLTLSFGSVGPLSYLIHRERVLRPVSETAPAAQAAPQHA